MVTHFIPADAVRNGRKRDAVCGTPVTAVQHSAEPTCPTCAGWLLDTPNRHRDDEATARALEAEFPEYAGRLTTEGGVR